MRGLSLRRWPRADNIALLPAADFSLSSRSYSFIIARSILIGGDFSIVDLVVAGIWSALLSSMVAMNCR